ncbi:MAG TPA: hypothetical protein VI837_08795 [Blastocatellia bacterium]|nr:hypothetical protein [Blastocatellia bacterium]
MLVDAVTFVVSAYLLFAVRDLGLSPTAAGLIAGCGGLGSLAGPMLAQPALRRLGAKTALIVGFAVGGAFQGLVPLARVVAMPVGALAGGIIGHLVSPRSALAAGALGISLAALWVVAAPIRSPVGGHGDAEPRGPPPSHKPHQSERGIGGMPRIKRAAGSAQLDRLQTGGHRADYR